MLSYVLPTRNRHSVLAHTLSRLASLPPHAAEIVIVDNASETPPAIPRELANGLPVRLIPLRENLGAASRNIGVRESDRSSNWIVMLDDDSYPLDANIAAILKSQPANIGAVMADIHLPRLNKREEGGLPEVFIGCGVAIRREIFESCGGYDPTFNYYVEEYDLAARLIRAGFDITFNRAWRIDHLKDNANRDMNLILQRLIRNNGWVAQRYAPDKVRRQDLRDLRRRYRRIAIKENALDGFVNGLTELRRTISSQPRTPLSAAHFARFTGYSAALTGLQSAFRSRPFHTASIVNEGKNINIIRAALASLGIPECPDGEVSIIGTMSPGPMLDAAESHPDWIAPWTAAQTRAAREAA